MLSAFFISPRGLSARDPQGYLAPSGAAAALVGFFLYPPAGWTPATPRGISRLHGAVAALVGLFCTLPRGTCSFAAAPAPVRAPLASFAPDPPIVYCVIAKR